MLKLTLPLLLIACALLSNCTSYSSGGRNTKDYWGDGAGPQGFGTVIIDAGHGGKDSGARSRSTGALEKNLALNVAKALRSELSGSFRVVMMRDDDSFIELGQRAARASKYTDGVLVSIHWNEAKSYIHGPETYYWRVDSYGMAERVQQSLSATVGSSNSRGLVRRRLRLTRNTEIPSILVECGYLSNKAEAARAVDPSYQRKIARAISNAIKTQAAQGDSGMGALPKSIHAPLSKNGDHRE